MKISQSISEILACACAQICSPAVRLPPGQEEELARDAETLRAALAHSGGASQAEAFAGACAFARSLPAGRKMSAARFLFDLLPDEGHDEACAALAGLVETGEPWQTPGCYLPPAGGPARRCCLYAESALRFDSPLFDLAAPKWGAPEPARRVAGPVGKKQARKAFYSKTPQPEALLLEAILAQSPSRAALFAQTSDACAQFEIACETAKPHAILRAGPALAPFAPPWPETGPSEICPALTAAIEAGVFECAFALLSRMPPEALSWQSSARKISPLWAAAAAGSPELCQAILGAAEDPASLCRQTCFYGLTPLAAACVCGSAPCAALLSQACPEASCPMQMPAAGSFPLAWLSMAGGLGLPAGAMENPSWQLACCAHLALDPAAIEACARLGLGLGSPGCLPDGRALPAAFGRLLQSAPESLALRCLKAAFCFPGAKPAWRRPGSGVTLAEEIGPMPEPCRAFLRGLDCAGAEKDILESAMLAQSPDKERAAL